MYLLEFSAIYLSFKKNKKIINLNLENWYLASGGLTVTENIIKEIKTSAK